MSVPGTVLVTGAAGFVGRAMLARLAADKIAVRAITRNAHPVPAGSTIEWRSIGEIDADTDWAPLLAGCATVVHLAARVHIMRDSAKDPLAEFRRVNVAGTLRLAAQAAASGSVRRFIFLSSVKVNGESGVYTENDAPAPADAYAQSKCEAEEGLRAIAANTGMEVVIIRPPLVYGPGVRANFRMLMRAVQRGIPLPLGAVNNRRSLVAVDNLVDFSVASMRHPAAANQTFLVSDGEDVTTAELIRRIAKAMDRPARLLPFPPTFLMAAAALAGRRDVAERLLNTLQVDISKARTLLGWKPPVTVDDGLRRAVAGMQ